MHQILSRHQRQCSEDNDLDLRVVHALVAILRKQLQSEQSLGDSLQTGNFNGCSKAPIDQTVAEHVSQDSQGAIIRQLIYL